MDMPAEPQIHDNILGTMGNTPLVRLNRVARGVRAQMVAKVEYFNPGGSVKDRIGITIIEEAEREGKLKPGGTIVESTIAATRASGWRLPRRSKATKASLCMPDKMSEEKIRLLRAFGARVVITPTNVEPDDPRSYYSVAGRSSRKRPTASSPTSITIPANPQTHYGSTGPELWQQTAGRLMCSSAGMGTGGTITGVGKLPQGAEPQNSDRRRRSDWLDPARLLLHGQDDRGAQLQSRGHRRGFYPVGV